jgi:hypothetical protein
MSTEDAVPKPAQPEPSPGAPQARSRAGRVPIAFLKPFPPGFNEKWKVLPKTEAERQEMIEDLRAYFMEILPPEGLFGSPTSPQRDNEQ